MRGGDLGKIVPSAILQKIAAATYAKVKGQEPPAEIGDWFLFDASNTLLLYSLNGSVNKTILCVIGVRGTVTGTDWEANITIPFNGLEDTTRYIEDAEKVEEWQQRIAKQLPGYTVLYGAVGHSLGGAICDDFLREGLVESALTFNSAIEPKNLGMAHEGFDIKRVYAHGDPLHDLFGRNADPPPLMLDFGDVNEILRHEPSNVIEFFKAKLNKHYLKTFNDVGQGDDPLMLGKGKKNLCGTGVGKHKKGGMGPEAVEELRRRTENARFSSDEEFIHFLDGILEGLPDTNKDPVVPLMMRLVERYRAKRDSLIAAGEEVRAMKIDLTPLYDLLRSQGESALERLRNQKGPEVSMSHRGRGMPDRKHTLKLLMGEGNQHKPFPYSRSDLTEGKKAIERSRHYRALDKARRFGISPPKEHQEMAAVRGLKPKKETTPKEGSERKPYVGAKMKRTFLKTHSATELKAAIRTYKKGGVSWESLM